MMENMICKKQLSLLDVILNMLFALTLILKLATLDTSSKLHSLIKVFNSMIYLAYFEIIMLNLLYLYISKTRNLLLSVANITKKGKRKVQGVPQSQTAALPRPKKEEKTDKSKQAQTNKRTKSTKISSLFTKRGNRNTKRTENHKNKMTHGKTYNKSPRRINHKRRKSKTITETTALERSVQ